MKKIDKISKMILDKINNEPYISLENYALYVLLNKLKKSDLLDEERILIVNGFLADLLEFDNETDEPIGNTLEIEDLIDFMLSNGRW